MEGRYLSGGGVAVAGVFLAAIQLLHGIQQTDRALVLAFEAGPFVLVALTLPYAGYWLATHEQYDGDVPRILAWGGGGVVLFVSVGALLLFGQRVFLGTLDRAAYVAIDHVTVGAVVGILVGLYDAKNRQTVRELQRERDRVEAFGNKAADVNNYGRALNRSEAIDEVSPLCIQGMQALLGVSEGAVLALSDEDADAIDDTTLDVSRETLRSLGERARGTERATLLSGDDVPAAVADRVEAVVAVEITAVADTSFVLVALVPDETALEDEAVQLLEMLTAHAGTAIDDIYAGRGAVVAGGGDGEPEPP